MILSVNNTKAPPQLAQIDYKFKILKSVRLSDAQDELFQTNQTELKLDKK